MEIAPLNGSPDAARAGAGRAAAAAAVEFSESLLSQQQLGAARDVLATLPTPIVYTLRDEPGSPLATVDRLFEVLQDGSFEPPPEVLTGTGIIAATARATQLFERPAQMWDAMRTIIGAGDPLREAVARARAEWDGAAPPAVAGAEDATRSWAASCRSGSCSGGRRRYSSCSTRCSTPGRSGSAAGDRGRLEQLARAPVLDQRHLAEVEFVAHGHQRLEAGAGGAPAVAANRLHHRHAAIGRRRQLTLEGDQIVAQAEGVRPVSVEHEIVPGGHSPHGL